MIDSTLKGSQRPVVLWMGPGTSWIWRAPLPPFDLRSRRPLRRLVQALVDARMNDAGALDLAGLRAVGWPGETMRWSAAVNRIHVALSELRRRGLRDVLRRGDEGYFLDPEVPIGWSDQDVMPNQLGCSSTCSAMSSRHARRTLSASSRLVQPSLRAARDRCVATADVALPA